MEAPVLRELVEFSRDLKATEGVEGGENAV